MLFIYRYLIHPLFSMLFCLVALWSVKGRRTLQGRRGWRDQLGTAQEVQSGVFRIHVHAASVGEFEQAKPLIESLRGEGSQTRITASFFSSSGYEQQHRYEHLDAACYLPSDGAGEVRDFLDVLAPDLILIVRYDLWPELLQQAKQRGIPTVLICGVLRSGSARFLPGIRSLFAWVYQSLTLICAVEEEDRTAFLRLVPQASVVIAGDSRYDRVIDRARSRGTIPDVIDGGISDRRVLVVGSTWPDDEKLLSDLHERPGLVLIIVPHEPTPEHLSALKQRLPGSRTLSEVELEPGLLLMADQLIIDRTGMLSVLYRMGDLAYVGGGFGAGVHSVLEPAAYGIPVFSGPGIDRSRDALAMRAAGGLRVVRSADELSQTVIWFLENESERLAAGKSAIDFVEKRAGATARILSVLRERGLL